MHAHCFTSNAKFKKSQKNIHSFVYLIFVLLLFFIRKAHMAFNSLRVVFERLNFCDTLCCCFQFTFDTQIVLPNTIQCDIVSSFRNALTHRQSIAWINNMKQWNVNCDRMEQNGRSREGREKNTRRNANKQSEFR